MTKALATTAAWSRGIFRAHQIAPPLCWSAESTWKIHCVSRSATSNDSPPVSTLSSPQKPYFSASAPMTSTAQDAVLQRSAPKRESSYMLRSAGPPLLTGVVKIFADTVDSPKARPCSLEIA